MRFYNNINKSLTSTTYQIIVDPSRRATDITAYCASNRKKKHIRLATFEVEEKLFVDGIFRGKGFVSFGDFLHTDTEVVIR